MRQTVAWLGLLALVNPHISWADSAMSANVGTGLGSAIEQHQPVPQQATPTAGTAQADARLVDEQQPTLTKEQKEQGERDQQHATQELVHPGQAVITDKLPEDIQQSLHQQGLTLLSPHDGRISSAGRAEQAPRTDQCPQAPECSKRYAMGIYMMAWGAVLVGAIGVIVWLGKSHHHECPCSVN